MARAVRERTLSPVELVRAALKAIERTEPHLNAWSEVLAERALAQAAVHEAEALQGRLRGPWHGVPIGVKDLFLTAGVPTRRGSRLYAQDIPSEDAPVVERMLRAGAIMVGKNTTAEVGWKAASTCPLNGVTRNPWDSGLSAGGSSSGSAVAVAAGNVPLSLGSDGGGSLRIPAAFCGIFSLKPTLGRVPTYPLSTTEHLSHAGVMTRSVADTAMALDVLKGPHPMDPYSLPEDGASWLAALDQMPTGRRVAIAPTLFGRTLDREVERCVAVALARLRQLPGFEFSEARLDLPDPVDIFDRLWVARGTSYLGRPATDLALVDPGLRRMIERSASLNLAGHLRALQDRAAFCRRVEREFNAFDLLVTPMMPVLPFAAEADGPPGMDEHMPVPWARWTPFSYPFNVTGQPAAALPCGWTEGGLPIALQVVGRRFADLQVLQLCAAWERAFDWKARKPPLHAGA